MTHWLDNHWLDGHWYESQWIGREVEVIGGLVLAESEIFVVGSVSGQVFPLVSETEAAMAGQASEGQVR